MQYHAYGKNGPMVSAIGFGVMRLPPRKKDDWGSVNFAKSVPLLRRAMESGINFFDSHHNYHDGLSEVAIGKALAGWKGQRIYIQTKTPFYREEKLDYFKKLVDQAIEKLGVECIDYLLFHSMNMKMFKQRGKEFFKLTDWAMKKGLIRCRGFSSHDSSENIKKFVDTGEFSAMLVSYNWLNRGVADAIAYAADAGMGVSVMNPVGGGSLAANTRPILSLLPRAKSSSEVALRYVLSTPGVCTAMSGMNTFEQIKENVAIGGMKAYMTPAARSAMAKKLAKLHAKSQVICTSCGYCMPCPHGVNIPENFMLFNRAKLLGLEDFARRRFGHLKTHKEGDKSAFACKKCGACLPKCPNKVKIIQQLAEAAKRLG
jgi:uncharacterized protein